MFIPCHSFYLRATRPKMNVIFASRAAQRSYSATYVRVRAHTRETHVRVAAIYDF